MQADEVGVWAVPRCQSATLKRLTLIVLMRKGEMAHLDIETVLLEEMKVVNHDQLIGGRQLKLERRNQTLGVNLRRLLKSLEVKLFVRGVLVDDEQIMTRACYYEAHIELAEHLRQVQLPLCAMTACVQPARCGVHLHLSKHGFGQHTTELALHLARGQPSRPLEVADLRDGGAGFYRNRRAGRGKGFALVSSTRGLTLGQLAALLHGLRRAS